MGKRRTERPVENGSFLDDFLEWMDCPEGQHSIEVSDLIFDALGAAGIDARRLKIVWADGTQLSIKQSAERIQAEHPDIPCDLIGIHVVGGSEIVRLKLSFTNACSNNSTGSSSRGSTNTSAGHEPPEKWPRTPHSRAP